MTELSIWIWRINDERRVCLDEGAQYKKVRASVAASPMQRALLVQALKAAGYRFDEDKLVRACIHVSQPPQPNSLRVRKKRWHL